MINKELVLAILERWLEYSPHIVICFACLYALGELAKELIKMKKEKKLRKAKENEYILQRTGRHRLSNR